MSTTLDFRSVGFIGLGAMGRPMAIHLANKLPAESRIYVFDVVQQVVDELSAQFPGRIIKGSSAKDIAQQSVCDGSC
jgi:3-hydroxyisobutyrate dehydrogenase-like beta-hydroxyacid dehydrogenase